jgi:calcium permeable stress-gated cation channel
MHTVALIFAPLAPLVAAVACLVFWLSSVTYKYQLMFVYTTKVESGGVSFMVIWRCKELMSSNRESGM